ncbi:SdiA-regulated domain-containing protein [Bacteroidota bacterium]
MLISFCNSSSNSQPSPGSNSAVYSNEEFSFPYNLSQPDTEYKLPSYLEEISGLSYCQSGKLACVQDEKANIYVLELGKKLNISTYKFGKDGDYEDIAVVGKTVYVIRNDGSIYRVKNFMEEDKKVKKYKTALSAKNDTEGMAFDPLSNSLLIACKGSPSIGKDNINKGYRAVYRFDLEEKELLEKPQFLIDLNNLDNYRDKSSFSKFSAKLAKRLGLVESETSFKPSGISIHPLYGDIYLISSIGKLMIVMDRRGKILEIQDLDDNLFRQPEGICFSPSGELYISNEGQGGKGYILKFKPLSDE